MGQKQTKSGSNSSKEDNGDQQVVTRDDQLQSSNGQLDVHPPQWPIFYMRKVLPRDQYLLQLRQHYLLKHVSDADLRLEAEKIIEREKAALSEDIISSRLKTRIYNSSETPDIKTRVYNRAGTSLGYCDKCMENFQDGDKVANLYYCDDEFHEQCIKKRLLKKNKCPVVLCRSLALPPYHLREWKGDIADHRKYFRYKL